MKHNFYRYGLGAPLAGWLNVQPQARQKREIIPAVFIFFASGKSKNLSQAVGNK